MARILKTIFEDAEWRTIPINRIAKHTRIPLTTVHRHHEKYAASFPPEKIAKPATRTVTRGGQTYEMDTGRIGRRQPPASAPKRRRPASSGGRSAA